MIDKAIIAGSFDPPTKGHLDLIIRSARLAKELIIAIACNEEKQSLLSLEQRKFLLQSLVADIPSSQVAIVHGKTAEFAKKENATVLIRGLREEKDLAYEMALAVYNKKETGIETLLLLADPSLSSVSSSFLKSPKATDADYRKCLPENLYSYVVPFLEEKKHRNIQ